MTKLISIFIVYFVAMYSLLIIIDLLLGTPFNVSFYQVLTPFEVTDPAELAILILLALISLAIPIIHYIKPFISKFTRND